MQDQNCFIWVLLGWNSKKLSCCFPLHQYPQMFSIKILFKNRFGNKIVLIRYFRLKFQKANVEFEISILEFVNMQSFVQKQKKLNLGPKILHLGIFGLQFSKNHCQIFNQHTLLCENIKFHAKSNKREQKYSIGVFGWNVEKLQSYF